MKRNGGLFKKGLLVISTFALFSCAQNNPQASEVVSSEEVSSSSMEVVSSSSIVESTESSEEVVTSEITSISQSDSSIESYEPYDYDGYYSTLESWENGEDLKKQLHDLISGGTYNPISYAGTIVNWESNIVADKAFDDFGRLNVVYSFDHIDPALTNTSWQREHAFPASLMCGKTTGDAVKSLGRATDFHNLFASYSSGNSARGNKNFGVADTESESYRSSGDSWGGYSSDEKNFEPGDLDKGRLSRAIFYMATMYSEDEYDDSGTLIYKGLNVVEEYVPYIAGENCQFAIGNLSSLLEWSGYGVDLQEYLHNESVYSYVPHLYSDPANDHAQGNRNPFVDYPDLVDYVFGEKKNEAGSLKDLVSTYDKLQIRNPSKPKYAISEAKRSYSLGEKFLAEDLTVVKYGKEMSLEETTDFEIYGVTVGSSLAVGNYNITVKTPLNSIYYTIVVKENDPFEYSSWSHTFTGKTAGGDLESIKNSPATDNVLTLDGMEWIIRYENGAIGNNNKNLGVAFGTSTVPVGTITFTANLASIGNLHTLSSIHFKGSAASGCTYTAIYSVNDVNVLQTTLGYKSQNEPVVISKFIEGSPVDAKVSIKIIGCTKAVYVKAIALDIK
ncbi:MAG: endonuclease [Bacilli bacterium]|nr:endonuclease [Bacilli bacterium]